MSEQNLAQKDRPRDQQFWCVEIPGGARMSRKQQQQITDIANDALDEAILNYQIIPDLHLPVRPSKTTPKILVIESQETTVEKTKESCTYSMAIRASLYEAKLLPGGELVKDDKLVAQLYRATKPTPNCGLGSV